MKHHFRRLAAAALALTVLSGLFVLPVWADAPSQTLTILFTHDTHDQFYPDAADKGGYVRLATLLKEQRETPTEYANSVEFLWPTVTLDAGDFSMGSLFQTVYTTDAPELRALGAMGYDVTTLGNHEFDYRMDGVTQMLNSAVEKWAEDHPAERKLPDGSIANLSQTGTLPKIVLANYKPPQDAAEAWAAWNNYPITDYVVIEKEWPNKGDAHNAEVEPIRIAVFGVLGVDADACAPMSGMEFEPIADAAKRVVAEIQQKEDADFIICLSHSGTEDGEGEDYALAKAVDGIDVIISGHTHTTLPEPILVNNTVIVSAGARTQNLGRLTISKKVSPDHTLSVGEYKLLPVDDSISPDPEMEALAASLQADVEENFLDAYGLGYNQVLTHVNGTDFTVAETGDLIGNAYIQAVKELEGDSYIPVDFAVVPDGVIRDILRTGPVTTAHAFDVLSLGSGVDGSPTYPLVSVYLTGADLKNAFEVDASISARMSAAALYGAGMHWTYNPNRMILDKVTYAVQQTGDGGTAPLRDDQLYRVVADLYSGQMLGAVEGQSFGLLTVTPRDENGELVTDLESRILKQDDGNELKAWYALASYLEGQGSVVPPPPSKTVRASWNPIELLKNPGAPTLILLAVLLVLALLVAFTVRFALRRIRGGRSAYRPYRGK